VDSALREGTFPTLWAPRDARASFTFCRLAHRSVRFEPGIGWQTDYPAPRSI
jgi:hypothetical protein